MKLINRTYRLTALWLLPVMIIGSLFCFYMIEHIAYEETDEFLTYEMERLVKYHQKHNELPQYHKVGEIIPDQKLPHPVFKDTLLLEEGDNEMIPHRELHFPINHKGRDFTIVLRHLLLGRDDIAQGTLLIIAGLMLLTALFLILIVNLVSRRIWAPFYQTLDRLTTFNITGPVPAFPQTAINEFQTLHNTLQTLLKKIVSDYRHNKEFNENASHELQTHLAVIRSNTEQLINQSVKRPKDLNELQKIYEAASKLSQIQKSLLTLSKIHNQEYNKKEPVDLQRSILHGLKTLSDTIALRGIKVTEKTAPCIVIMDPGLAEILIINLLKNAIKHNIQDGHISIRLNAHSLVIENSGEPYPGNPRLLLERFAKGEKGNAGIGLAIVKEICTLHDFAITYEIFGQTTHVITIVFKPE